MIPKLININELNKEIFNLSINKKYNNIVILKSNNIELIIKEKEESILGLIYKFGFITHKLLYKWLDFNNDLYNYDIKLYIDNLLKLNILYSEDNIFYYPTNLLKDLIKDSYKNKINKSINIDISNYNKTIFYKEIPDIKLDYILFIMDLSFNILNNNNYIIKNILNNDSRFSYLEGNWVNLKGNNVIYYEDIGSTHIYSYNPELKKKLYIKNNINIKTNNRVGKELINNELFAICLKEYKDNNEYYNIHIPKMVIPYYKDENMLSQSIAIEIEYSSKQLNSYIRMLNFYKYSNIYGTLIIYIRDSKTLKNINIAINKLKIDNINIIIQEI